VTVLKGRVQGGAATGARRLIALLMVEGRIMMPPQLAQLASDSGPMLARAVPLQHAVPLYSVLLYCPHRQQAGSGPLCVSCEFCLLLRYSCTLNLTGHEASVSQFGQASLGSMISRISTSRHSGFCCAGWLTAASPPAEEVTVAMMALTLYM
jgi:hypothetical protein